MAIPMYWPPRNTQEAVDWYKYRRIPLELCLDALQDFRQAKRQYLTRERSRCCNCGRAMNRPVAVHENICDPCFEVKVVLREAGYDVVQAAEWRYHGDRVGSGEIWYDWRTPGEDDDDTDTDTDTDTNDVDFVEID